VQPQQLHEQVQGQMPPPQEPTGPGAADMAKQAMQQISEAEKERIAKLNSTNSMKEWKRFTRLFDEKSKADSEVIDYIESDTLGFFYKATV